MAVWDDLLDVVICAECGGVSGDISLNVCPADGAVLAEIRQTEAEFDRGRPFGAHG